MEKPPLLHVTCEQCELLPLPGSALCRNRKCPHPGTEEQTGTLRSWEQKKQEGKDKINTITVNHEISAHRSSKDS